MGEKKNLRSSSHIESAHSHYINRFFFSSTFYKAPRVGNVDCSEGIAQGLTSQQGIALRKKNHTTSLVYSQEPSVEVFCPTVNIIILKLGY